MQQELFQHEYVEELQKNPLLQLSLKCSQFNQFVAECEAKHGPGNAECQSGRLEAAACAASVFAPSHFSKWIACLDANQDKANPLEECENQGMDAIEESANQ